MLVCYQWAYPNSRLGSKGIRIWHIFGCRGVWSSANISSKGKKGEREKSTYVNTTKKWNVAMYIECQTYTLPFPAKLLLLVLWSGVFCGNSLLANWNASIAFNIESIYCNATISWGWNEPGPSFFLSMSCYGHLMPLFIPTWLISITIVVRCCHIHLFTFQVSCWGVPQLGGHVSIPILW